MQKILVSAWVTLALVIVISIVAQAQESHPMYDNALNPAQGSHPTYDSAPGGNSHPIYDNTLPPQVSNQTGIGRSINSLQSVVSDLQQTEPDAAGRRDKALLEANDALLQLQYLQRSHQ